MLPVDVLRQVRRLQIRARRAVHGSLGGAYQSAFRGTGLSFEEVREYHPGDDVRRIDWNVTARAGLPFVKRYAEERELTILLAIDLSASLRFGTGPVSKRQAASEVAALLAVAAMSNGDRVGLAGFTNTVEKFIPPAKGTRHVLRVLREVLAFEPAGKGTDLTAAFDYLNRVHRRRAVVFLVSDFLDDSFEKAFRRTARRHDLIAVRVTDARERTWPAIGLVQLEDAETSTQLLIDTGDARFRSAFLEQAASRRQAFSRLARSAGVEVIEADTGGGHAEALVKFFRLRERRRRRG